MPAVTIDEQIACLLRERAMRAKVYPRWVAKAKLTQAAADEEMCRIGAAIETLQAVKAKQDAHVPDALEVRRGERKLVLGFVLPMMPSDAFIRLEKRLFRDAPL